MTEKHIEMDCWKLRDIVSDLYLAMILPATRDQVIACECDLIRAASTLGAILDELRQERKNSLIAAE